MDGVRTFGGDLGQKREFSWLKGILIHFFGKLM